MHCGHGPLVPPPVAHSRRGGSEKGRPHLSPYPQGRPGAHSRSRPQRLTAPIRGEGQPGLRVAASRSTCEAQSQSRPRRRGEVGGPTEAGVDGRRPPGWHTPTPPPTPAVRTSDGSGGPSSRRNAPGVPGPAKGLLRHKLCLNLKGKGSSREGVKKVPGLQWGSPLGRDW